MVTNSPRSEGTVPVQTAAVEAESTSFGAWTLLWVVYVTKLVTVVFVFLAARSYEAAALLTVTTWFWLGPLVAIGAAPIAYRWRIRRVRRRRRDLIAAEWFVKIDPVASTHEQAS